MMYMPKRRKIAVLVTWPVFASAVQISHKSTKIALKYRRKNFQYGLRPPSWICNISNFCQMSVLGMEIRIFISIDRNQLINGWDMEIKLFSKWRPSVIILNLQICRFGHVTYICMWFYLRSEFLINRPMWRRDSQKRFSIWRPSAILNLNNFDFLSNVRPRNKNMHQHTKFDRNRIIHGWDMEIKLFFKIAAGRHLELANIPVLITWHICLWFFISDSNFALIGHYGAEIWPKSDFQYGVRPPSWICYGVMILHQKSAFFVPNLV